MASLMWERDISGSISDTKATFSSWDKCMEKAYCKWPVIAVIVIGSLILLSVITCVARCICCGAECACCCFRCCAGCCGSGRGHKTPAPPSTMPGFGQSGGYAPPLVNSQYRAHPAPTYEPPQYANFEGTSKPANPDALPAMPGWNEASKTYVEEHNRDDVELKPLDPSRNHVAGVPAAATQFGQTPLRSPMSPEQGYRSPNTHQQGEYFHTSQESGVYREDRYQDSRQNLGHAYEEDYPARQNNRALYPDEPIHNHESQYNQQGHFHQDPHYRDPHYQDRSQQAYPANAYARQQSPQYDSSQTRQHEAGSYQQQPRYHQFERPQQQGWHLTRSPVNGM